jgi:hypothetical protein
MQNIPHFPIQRQQNPSIIVLNSDRGCWQCEQPLPVAPLAVVAGEPIMLVCSPVCAERLARELGVEGRNPRPIDADETCSLLRNTEILGVLESWWMDNRYWYAFFTGKSAGQRARALLQVH